MDLRKEDLPATLQAFDLQNDKEIFIAEQVVNNQAEIELFTTRYTGKLIKAKIVPAAQANRYVDPVVKKKPSSNSIVMVIVILVLVALILYGFSTGWIQDKLNLKI